MILIILFICYAIGGFCTGKKHGFYCVDHSTFIWCYGTDSGSSMKCSSGTSCKCGYSSYNPCGFSFQTMSDCIGSPGGTTEPPEESTPSETPDNDYC